MAKGNKKSNKKGKNLERRTETIQDDVHVSEAAPRPTLTHVDKSRGRGGRVGTRGGKTLALDRDDHPVSEETSSNIAGVILNRFL